MLRRHAYMPEFGHFWGSWGSEVWGPRPFQHLLTSSSPLLSDIRSYCQDCLLTLSSVGMPRGPGPLGPTKNVPGGFLKILTKDSRASM